MSDMFEHYAPYYDLLYRDKDYAAEVEYVAANVRKHAPLARRVLDLGCGTGAHAELLARLGYTVDGVDMSEAMLARAEARKARLPNAVSTRLSFCHGDVRTVRMNTTYDAVVSLFHVMSYQASNADVEAAFETASIHLRRGGLFLFDFWYGPAVLTQRPEVRVRRLEDDDIELVRIAEPVLRVNENVVDVNYTVSIRVKATGKVDQVREQHRMRYFFLPELECYRKKAWGEVASQAWMGNEPPNAQSWAGIQILVRM